MASLDNVRQKIIRAQIHFAEFQAELHRYIHSEPIKVVREAEGDPNKYIGTVKTWEPIPARLPIIIGDCLQNLRSSLDYLVWELVLSAKNTPGKNNAFPICKTLQAFDDQVSKQRRLDGVSPDAIAEIRSLQPYHEGKDFDKSILWVMDEFCNINKHRRILIFNFRGTSGVFETKIVDGQLFVRLSQAVFDKDAKVGPFPTVDGPQGRGIKMEMDTQIVAFIAFDEGAAKNMEVSLILGWIFNYIGLTVLPKFERFFS